MDASLPSPGTPADRPCVHRGSTCAEPGCRCWVSSLRNSPMREMSARVHHALTALTGGPMLPLSMNLQIRLECAFRHLTGCERQSLHCCSVFTGIQAPAIDLEDIGSDHDRRYRSPPRCSVDRSFTGHYGLNTSSSRSPITRTCLSFPVQSLKVRSTAVAAMRASAKLILFLRSKHQINMSVSKSIHPSLT
jgi:hypothetical protein